MNNTITKTAVLNRTEKQLFYAFFALAILMLGSYLYFANASLQNIVARKRAEEQIGRMQTEVARMEAEYMALASLKLTPDYAKSLGFKEVSASQKYAVKAKETVTLSLGNNEI